MKILQNLGLNINNNHFGNIKPDFYNVSKNHFKPYFRHVFIADCDWNGGFVYITSNINNINGLYRGYRCRNSYDIEIGNIFALGKTLDEAKMKFEYNFKNKIYNKS